MHHLLFHLESAERRFTSQNGEDGVIEAIFAAIGTTNRYFVEFGVQDATECNSARLLARDWSGLLMDGDGISRNPRATVQREFVTAENVNSLFGKYGVPREFDLLSIDIDGNDYWVWRAIEYRPRVVVIEYNASVPPTERRTIAYDPSFRWNGTDYCGASLRALAELGSEKGYALVYCERAGVNAFFVERSALPPGFAPRAPEQVYRPPNYFYRGERHPPDPLRRMIDPREQPVALYGLAAAAPMASVAEALAIALKYHQARCIDAAEDLYRRILSADPGHADARHLLGVATYQKGKHEAAAGHLARAIAANPNVAAFHHHLGLVNAALGKLEEARASYSRALELAPDLAEAHNGLGNVFKDLGQPEPAEACYRRALQLKPEFADGHINLGNVLELLGLRTEAAVCYERALALQPEHPNAHWNSALLKLLVGDFERGWPEYEWRWRTNWMKPRRYGQPRWSGERFEGGTLLLHFEQGLGDTIQCVRYAQLVKARGGTVIVQCQDALLGVLAGCPGVDRLVGESESLPPFDLHAPLLSLPMIFGTTVGTIPRVTEYATASPDLVARWRERLSPLAGFKVGISWQGNASYPKDRYRSIPLRFFMALAQVPGVSFVSLQKGAGAAQLAEHRFPVLDFSQELDEAAGPFMDTAAIMKNVDLVITSDTVIPHLAGALGVPAWVALPFAPDWRWLLERDDSPWYPEMRLFRQKALGDWTGVFAEIERALRERASAG
jgi:tetratricopeptide (TPR) repeat protein